MKLTPKQIEVLKALLGEGDEIFVHKWGGYHYNLYGVKRLLPKTVEILSANYLIQYHSTGPLTGRYTITDKGREVVDRLVNDEHYA